jgi:hypothetical protein
MARKIKKINAFNFGVHKNGLDVSTISMAVTLIDEAGNYQKTASYSVLISTLPTGTKNAILALYKGAKDFIETQESLTKLPDPVIKDPGVITI